MKFSGFGRDSSIQTHQQQLADLDLVENTLTQGFGRRLIECSKSFNPFPESVEETPKERGVYWFEISLMMKLQ
jgi:hypothetical protein